MKITIEMNADDLKTFLEARDHLLRQIADLKRTPAKGSAEERADLILNAYPGLTPTQKTEIRERIKANILG